MKKITFIFITLVLTSIVSQAQTNVYHPFPDSDAQWNGQSWYKSSMTTVTYDTYSLIISGDTTIGSLVYHKLYKSGNIIYSAISTIVSSILQQHLCWSI